MRCFFTLSNYINKRICICYILSKLCWVRYCGLRRGMCVSNIVAPLNKSPCLITFTLMYSNYIPDPPSDNLRFKSRYDTREKFLFYYTFHGGSQAGVGMPHRLHIGCIGLRIPFFAEFLLILIQLS